MLNQIKITDMEKLKTFDDLVFEDWNKLNDQFLAERFKGHKQAFINFFNGYGASVIFGSTFRSNGIDTYEIAILHDGNLCYDSGITNDVIGNQSKTEITEILEKIQKLPKR